MSEDGVLAEAQAVVRTGLARIGYRYINVDDCWMAWQRDGAGSLQADGQRFPHGIAWLAAQVHRLGLRFGLYTELGSATCTGRPGSAGHETRDAQDLAAWGADFVKVDRCSLSYQTDFATPYAVWRDALRATGRPMVFSIASYGFGRPWVWGSATGHMWRTTPDLAWYGDPPGWRSVVAVASKSLPLARFAGPGGWNDPDMLALGLGTLTFQEERSAMSLWAMMAAPLLVAGRLPAIKPASRALLSNEEVLALDQDALGRGARLVSRQGEGEIWVKSLANGDQALLFLNGSVRYRSFQRALSRNPCRTFAVRDLWRHRAFRRREMLKVGVPGHGVALFRVRPVSRGVKAGRKCAP